MLDLAVQLHHTSTTVGATREDIGPDALGDPCLDRCHAAVKGGGRGQRAYHELISEEILVAEIQSLLFIGIIVIQRSDHGCQLRVRPISARVDIGNQTVAQTEIVADNLLGALSVHPRLLARKRIVTGVHTKHGRENTELNPADEQFTLSHTRLEAADIMAPAGVAHVGGICRKVGLESKGFPRSDGVTRKSEGITVSAKPREARENHAAAILFAVVKKMEVVQSPERIQSLDSALGSLLPVDPAEIGSQILVGMDQMLEIRLDEIGRGNIKVDRVFLGGIHTHLLGDGGIDVLIALHTVGGMEIESAVQSAVVQML